MLHTELTFLICSTPTAPIPTPIFSTPYFPLPHIFPLFPTAKTRRQNKKKTDKKESVHCLFLSKQIPIYSIEETTCIINYLLYC